MTPDESAWTQFFAATLASGFDHSPGSAASLADAALAELRRRREAGAFGPRVDERPDPEAPGQARADEARWLQATMRAKATERERDEQRARAEAAETHARGLNAEAEAINALHDQAVARAGAAEASFEGAHAEAEARLGLLKEALGNLRSWRDGGRPFESTVDLIAKAKAVGYGP